MVMQNQNDDRSLSLSEGEFPGFETKEISLLIFDTGNYRFGINLCKVREICPFLNIQQVPYSHPAVPGVFQLRGSLVPAVSLRRWLELSPQYPTGSRIIVSQFLGLRVGFLVDRVDRIYRLSWKDIAPPDWIQNYTTEILGTVKMDDSLVTLIDYENIVLTINPDIISPFHGETGPGSRRKDSKKLVERRKTRNIWIVEDSTVIRDYLKNLLMDCGYSNIVFFENGRHALDTLAAYKKNTRKYYMDHSGYPIEERVDVIITDIEMPEMNGYQLLKTVKEDEILKSIPVVFFSSTISCGAKLRGEIAEADAQLSKSESANLINLLDRIIFVDAV